MSCQLLAIGLDAAESTLIEGWAAEGRLPHIARLAEEGAVARLSNPMDTLPGAIWPEITSGLSAGRVPLYFHPRQLRTGEARRRPIEAEDLDPESYYWTIAARAGRRVAAIDQVQTVPCRGSGCVELIEWGLHDRYFDIQSEPPELIDELRQRYGRHPVADRQLGPGPDWACDGHGGTREGYERLLAGLLAGADQKTEILDDLVRRERWDLVTAVYGETHCVGHQFWHFHDPADPGHDPEAPASLRNAVREVYSRVDAGIGRLAEAAGPDATVIVYASHGMGRYIGGPKLLPEFLVRMGLSSAGSGGGGAGGWLRRLQERAKKLPRRLHPLLWALARNPLVARLQAAGGGLADPLESPRTRAVAMTNNRCGAIRLNLAGREPYGRVTPGSEAAALVEDLKRELLQLRQPGSGEPIVRRVTTAEETFGARAHPDVPDLMVVFRDDLGHLDACYSERVGTIEIEPFDPNYPRSGDHTTESRLWIRGPGLPAGARLEDADVLDLAPTVLALLGVEPPARLDGEVLPAVEVALSRREESRA